VIRRPLEEGRAFKGLLAAPALATMLLASCGASQGEASAERDPDEWSADSDAFATASSEDAEMVERQPFDEDAAREAAESAISDETYVGIGVPYGCTEDCSGHEAGFRYRAENGYVGYNADSPSFNGKRRPDTTEDQGR